MVNINLLPWREAERQEKQRQFLSVLSLVAIFGVAFMWMVYTFYSGKIENQRERNKFLQTEIRKLDSKIKEITALENKRRDLIERMKTIQDLQKSRPQIVHVFDEIVATLPEGVKLSSIARTGEQLVWNAVAESSPRISKFMRNLKSSKWLEMELLEGIDTDNDSGANRKRFVLKTKITSPDDQKEKK